MAAVPFEELQEVEVEGNLNVLRRSEKSIATLTLQFGPYMNLDGETRWRGPMGPYIYLKNVV